MQNGNAGARVGVVQQGVTCTEMAFKSAWKRVWLETRSRQSPQPCQQLEFEPREEEELAKDARKEKLVK